MEDYKGYAIIYMFTCPNGKSYIGQTINFKERYKKYKGNNNSIGRHFSNAISKYQGIENFELEILEKFKIDEPIEKVKTKLDLLEISYIDKYDTLNNGYNLVGGGKGSYKRCVSKETREKLSKSNIGKNSIEKLSICCGSCKENFTMRPSEYRRRLKLSVSKELFCSRRCLYLKQMKDN